MPCSTCTHGVGRSREGVHGIHDRKSDVLQAVTSRPRCDRGVVAYPHLHIFRVAGGSRTFSRKQESFGITQASNLCAEGVNTISCTKLGLQSPRGCAPVCLVRLAGTEWLQLPSGSVVRNPHIIVLVRTRGPVLRVVPYG